MNNTESRNDSDSSNKVYNINNNNNKNNISNNIDSENININISDSQYNSIVTNNIVNLSNFLNNECINIYVTRYRLYNTLFGGRDVDIIDFNYKKGTGIFCLIPKSFLVIILKCHSWCDPRLSLQKLCLGLVFDKGCYSRQYIRAN